MTLRKHMNRIGLTVAAAGFGLALVGATTTPAKAAYAVGILNCVVGPSAGVIVMTPATLDCTFHPSKGPSEHYTGRIMKAGFDVGVTAGTAISWGVVDKESEYAPDGLAGVYGGASAEASVGIGVGANALFGGSNQSLVLTPISVQGQVGIGFALGISAMELNRA